jgi:predicted nucleic acid-binding protein
MNIVLDASVAVKWFNEKNEDYIETAVEIQGQKISGHLEIIVPDLFFLEVLNAFLTKSGFGSREISTIQQSLQKLNLKIVYPNNAILEDTVKIASTSDLTIYDSLYIAVAKVYEAPLFTEDKKILSCKCKHKLIRHIKEFGTFQT